MLDRLQWTHLPSEEVEKILSRVLFDGDDTALEHIAATGRTAELPFYSTVRLVEVELVVPDHDPIEKIYVLDGEHAYFYLDGTSGPVHAANGMEGVHIDDATAPDYLRFFCFAIRGDEGAFRLFEQPAVDVAGEGVAPEVSQVASLARPVEAAGLDEAGRRLFTGQVEYGGALFQSEFAVGEDGMVEMLDDEPVLGDVPPEPFVELPALRPAEAVAALVWTKISLSPPGEDTLTALVRLLLERTLAAETESRLLSHFNARLSKRSPLERFAHLLGTASPVVAVESALPFVEETIAGIVNETLAPEDRVPLFRAKPSAHDDTQLSLHVPDEGPALGLIPFHAYRGIADAQRVAYEISSRDVSCLVGCERVDDLPAGLREVLDLTLELPRLDAELFQIFFRRLMGAPPPPDWADGDAHWVTHVHHVDFQHPVGLGLTPAETVEFIRGRAEERLRDVEPVGGLGLSDLHGLGEARIFAEDLITDIGEAVGGRLDWMHVDRGVLLVGDPGTGKTTLARAVAQDCGIRFVNASAAGWQTAGHLGDHIRAMRADFSLARRFAPSILFIDEIDSIGNRETFFGSNSQYMTEVVNALLEQIQGMDPEAPVIVIGATNFEDRVDPALKRAGRLDRVIRIPRPNARALAQIYEHYLDAYLGGERSDGIDSRALGGLSLGATGADVELFVRGAMRRARREDRDVAQADLVAEITRKPRNPDAVRRLTPEEVRRVAVHEAGHALAACLGSGGGEDISFVTVVPRSDGTLGFVAQLPSERAFLTRTEYLERLEVYLAGRAAEEMIYGADGVSSGAGGSDAGSDLAVATRAAVELVTRQGLGPEGGLLWTAEPDDDQLAEAHRLLQEAYERARARLEANRQSFEAITEALVDRQEMTGDEVREVVDGRG